MVKVGLASDKRTIHVRTGFRVGLITFFGILLVFLVGIPIAEAFGNEVSVNAKVFVIMLGFDIAIASLTGLVANSYAGKHMV